MNKLNKAIYLICFSLILTDSVQALELCGDMAQGELIQGQSENIEHVYYNNSELALADDGSFLFAFPRNEEASQTLQITADKNNTHSYPLAVMPTQWDIQKINGVSPRKVEPTESDYRKIHKEQDDLKQALSYNIKTPYWKTGFIMPVKGRTSGNFGGQRIMNGKAKSPHSGMDIAAAEGSPVYAASDGVVTLSDGEYFYTGNMVVIAHGQNLSTIYAHLKSATVKKGDKVKQGDIIGHVGKTGRATGPHLHWGASVNGVRFQPLSLLKIGDKNLCKNL